MDRIGLAYSAAEEQRHMIISQLLTADARERRMRPNSITPTRLHQSLMCEICHSLSVLSNLIFMIQYRAFDW